MAKPERDVQNAIFRWLVMHRHLAIRVNSGATVQPESNSGNRGRRFIRFATWQIIGVVATYAGISDILACVAGRFVAIEVKAPGKAANLSPPQEMFGNAVRRCGGLFIVAESIDDVARQLSPRVEIGPLRSNDVA